MKLGPIFRGISFRIWLPFAAALTLSIVALGLYYPRVQEELFRRTTRQKFTELAKATALSVELSIDREAYAALAKSIELTTTANSFAFVAIIQRDAAGTETVFASNPPDTPPARILAREDPDLLYTSAPFRSDAMTGSVVLAASEAQLAADIRALNVPVYRALAVILVLSLIAVTLLARALSQPIKQLTQFASSLRSHDYSVAPPPPPSATELSQLNAALVELRDSLSAAQRENAETNRRLVEARDAAQSADRAKGAFVANMSHEIRTPLNAIRGLSHLCQQTELQPKQREYVSKIGLAAQTLTGIVNDILDFSKIEAGALEIEAVPFRIGEIVAQLDAIVGDAARRKALRFEVTGVTEADIPLVGDALRIQQVLLNLTGNAVKFTPRGSIRVNIAARDLGDGRVELGFRVADTGIGLSDAQRERLFQSFSQADASTTRLYGGTGLGLVISRRLTQAMGGDITVESRQNQGSTFSFHVIVRRDSQPAPAQVDGVRAAPPNFSGRRILVAEDNDFNQQIMRELLERTGAEVLLAENGAEAISRLGTNPGIELVLMDVQMPVMDGLEASRQIRRNLNLPSVIIVAMTANVTVEDRRMCEEAGMNDFLGKPLEPRRVMEVLGRWLKPNGTAVVGDGAENPS